MEHKRVPEPGRGVPPSAIIRAVRLEIRAIFANYETPVGAPGVMFFSCQNSPGARQRVTTGHRGWSVENGGSPTGVWSLE